MDDILKQNLIKELGLDLLSQEKQEEMLLSIGEIIFMRVISRIMDELDGAEKAEFEKILIEKPDNDEAIFGFLNSKISNFDEIVGEEIAGFKQESLNLMK